MKCFEHLILSHIKVVIPETLDPFQFAYRSNSSVDDAVSLALHTVLRYLDKSNTYVTILVIDYSSAFNTIIHSKLFVKLGDIRLCHSISNLILDFVSDRPQVVKIVSHTSSLLVLNMGLPQGCALSPLLDSLFSCDCAVGGENNFLVIFAYLVIHLVILPGHDFNQPDHE